MGPSFLPILKSFILHNTITIYLIQITWITLVYHTSFNSLHPISRHTGGLWCINSEIFFTKNDHKKNRVWKIYPANFLCLAPNTCSFKHQISGCAHCFRYPLSAIATVTLRWLVNPNQTLKVSHGNHTFSIKFHVYSCHCNSFEDCVSIDYGVAFFHNHPNNHDNLDLAKPSLPGYLNVDSPGVLRQIGHWKYHNPGLVIIVKIN